MNPTEVWTAVDPSSVIPYPEVDDETLMERVRAADDLDAFEELVQRYTPVARRIFLGYFGRDADVEDLVQTCFIKIFEARRRYRSYDRFRAWFYRLAINVAHDHWRRRERRRRWTFRFQRQRQIEMRWSSPESHQEQAAVRQHWEARLAHAIQRLPKRQRQVLILRYVEEMNIHEIAEVLGIRVGSVKSTLHHAIRKLQKMLTAPEQDHA